jgi:hypothetical protein
VKVYDDYESKYEKFTIIPNEEYTNPTKPNPGTNQVFLWILENDVENSK